jgi:hypothetical protein
VIGEEIAMWAYDDRRWAIIDGCFLVIWALLSGYALLSWQGLVGGDPWRPGAFALLTGGMALQSLASLVRRRSTAISYPLLVAAMTAIAASLFMVF